jgi:hypothetical protein
VQRRLPPAASNSPPPSHKPLPRLLRPLLLDLHASLRPSPRTNPAFRRDAVIRSHFRFRLVGHHRRSQIWGSAAGWRCPGPRVPRRGVRVPLPADLAQDAYEGTSGEGVGKRRCCRERRVRLRPRYHRRWCWWARRRAARSRGGQ